MHIGVMDDGSMLGNFLLTKYSIRLFCWKLGDSMGVSNGSILIPHINPHQLPQQLYCEMAPETLRFLKRVTEKLAAKEKYSDVINIIRTSISFKNLKKCNCTFK